MSQPPGGQPPEHPHDPPYSPPGQAAQPPQWAPQWVPQPQFPPGTGWIRFHLQGSKWGTSPITPTVEINGYPQQVRYGENLLPVPPGRHRISASAQWMRTYGQAECDVDVAPGAVVDVWYAAPRHQFATGNMGFTPQRAKGTAVLILLVILGGILGGLAAFYL